MAEQPDGIEEAFESSARIALTAAGLMAERLARAREQNQRDAQASSEQETRELQTRLDAERAAARAQLAPVAGQDWWERAGPGDVVQAWETANQWKDIDPSAQATVQRMREQLRERYGIDTGDLAADPAAVRDALEARERDDRQAARERDQARAEEADAARLMLDADRADQDQERGVGETATGEPEYDSAERRLDLAASLEGRGDEEAIEARVLADTNQAHPAEEAVAQGPRRTPAAKRARGKAGPVRGPARRSDRGR